MDTEVEALPTFTISKAGDVLLQAKNDSGEIIAQYRVSSSRLMSTSVYCQKVFQSDFSEGQRFRKEQERLQHLHQDISLVPISDLSTIAIPLPVGAIQETVLITAIKLLLQAMHQDKNMQQEEDEDFLLPALSSDINLFAHVVAVADQLDASQVVRHVAEQILTVQPMCQKRPKKRDADSARYWRQLLYIAYLHKQAKSFGWISGTMILYGLEDHDTKSSEAPWYNLPNNIEEEISIRRDGLFNTISSIPNSLLKPYMQTDKSRPTICTLGYGNSHACDSFQLGESIRWLCRRKLASPNLAMVYATAEDELFVAEGTPRDMIKTLKEFPDYQVDGFHNRCGIKGKLMQILDSLGSMLVDPKKIGLCLRCWQSEGRDRTSWSMERRPNATPYQGNLAKDLQSMQVLRAQTEVVAQLRQEVDVVKNDSHLDFSDHWTDRLGIGRISYRAFEPQRRGLGPDLYCPYIDEHVLYAKVFTAEKWTEKIWLTGDELPANPPNNTIMHKSLKKSPRK